MARHIINLRQMGRDAGWLLIQQAMGMPDAKMQSDFMVDRVALLLFARPSLPERMCVTAAVRQMGGTTIYQGDKEEFWRQEVNNFQEHLLPIFGYYMDCLYCYAIPLDSLTEKSAYLRFPIINAGSPEAHPAHALADLACMLKICKSLEGKKAAWVGCANGTLYSLLETTSWFPFSLRISIPQQMDTSYLQMQIERLKTDVQIVSSPEEAVRDANFIYAGKRCELPANVFKSWSITSELMSLARKDAKLLLSASPLRAIDIDPEIMASPASMLNKQAEYRLRIHKRMLHWVYEK